jgi:L-iditol 2-dehydrogenase
MKAVFLPGDKRVEIRAVDVPTPGPGEVLVEVKASCICRSDLSLYYGNAVVGGEGAGKCITGHEPSGVIASTGVGVRRFKVGDRVAVYLGVGCGVCSACRMGNFFLCRDWRCLGFTADGGNAEYLVVPERNCLRIPNSMSYVAAAISTDAFGTLYSACKKLQINGASIVALDPMAERRQFAAELGADLTLDPTAPDARERLDAFTRGAGLHAAIDCSGNSAGQNMALDSTRPLGRVAFVGESRETTIRPSDQLIRKELTLIGSWYFNVSEYEEIVDVLTRGNIDLERLATHRFHIDDAETAFRLFDERKTEKAVFVF